MSALFLSELTVSHFRSYKTMRLALECRPIVIFGTNGAGKTNILEAVSMISPGRGLRGAKLRDIARMPELLGWKVAGLLHSLGQTYEIETRAEDGAARSVSIDGKLSAQIALGDIGRIIWLVPAMDRLWIEGAEGRRRFLDRITLSFEPAHAKASVIYEKAMRQRNRLLKDMVRDPMWYMALEQQMAEAGAAIHAHRTTAIARLHEAMACAKTAFPQAQLSIEGDDSAAQEDHLREALAASRTADMRTGRTLIGPHRADFYAIYKDKGVHAKYCSTGEQKALLLSLILANARALAKDFGAPPIMLLDEIAAHLDSARRAALYDEICALKAQSWMTGTGAELFADLGDRAQRFEVCDQGGLSCVEPVPRTHC